MRKLQTWNLRLVRSHVGLLILLIGALGCGGCCGGCGNPDTYRAKQIEESRKVEQAAQVERDLKEFAEKNVPELQKVINDMEKDLMERQERLMKLRFELHRLGKESTTDETHKRWSSTLEETNRHRNDLLLKRKEAYLAFKKFELSPQEDKLEYMRRLELAKKAAAESRDYFEKMQSRREGGQ